jgi:hypothetical protein
MQFYDLPEGGNKEKNTSEKVTKKKALGLGQIKLLIN